jgi:serine protease Do
VQRILADLQAGRDVTSFGVNGQAVNDGQGTSGIWVSSVKSGSPADNAGVKPGDIITRLEGLVLSTAGTMGDYCRILRGHTAGDVLSLQVLRFSTKEILEGQLNGRALQRVTTFGDDNGGGGGDNGGGGGNEPTGDYVAITDDSSAISVEVPKTWKDRISRTDWDFADDGSIGVSLAIAPSIKKFQETWGTPGFFIGASRALAQKYTDDEILDQKDWKEDCADVERDDYSLGDYAGRYELYTECGPDKAAFIEVAAAPAGRPYVIYAQFQVVPADNWDIANHIAETMKVVGDLP